ncbi:cache domain-containing protein, partial [Campylobacter sp. VTCC 70190]|uniref:cache domain-containing protein n=1 Tax=Campylobacter sp. VTCC 70190 TaxID=3392118 RepID=UPI00398F3719
MKFTIRGKMLLLAFAALISVIATFATFFVNNQNGLKMLMNESRDILEGEVNNKIQTLTLAMAQSLGDLLENVPNEKEKIAIIDKAIENFRFEQDKSGYFFVYKKTTNVAHPVRKDLIGKDLKDAKDANGVYYVQELYKKALNGGGFVFYDFTKGGSQSSIAQKNAYSVMIPNTDDIWISTGVYVDTLEPYIQKEMELIPEHFQAGFIKSLAIATLLIVAICPFAFFFYKQLNFSIIAISSNINSFFDFINHKTKNIATIDVKTNDEFGQISNAINENILATKKGLEQDNQAVKESVETVSVVESGNLTARITANPRNPQLIELKNVLNKLLDVLQARVGSNMNEIHKI